MKKYDLCIIGAGPSGYAAAIRAIDFGKKIALIERKKIGGAGIFDGALSSKTLWELSEKYKLIKELNNGYTVYDSELNYQSVVDEMNRAVVNRFAQLKEQLDYFIKKGKIDFYNGSGKMLSNKEVEISYENDSEIIYAENTVLAIGSRPRKLPNIPIDEKTIVTSDSVTHFKDFPKSIVILGAGVIGCEFATIFSNFGRTKVFLIDKADRILPFEDEDISSNIASNLERSGVHIHRGASLESMKIVDGKVEYSLNFKDGRKEIYTVEKALVSVGRVPNSENIGLREIGLELSDRGHCIDSDTQTNISNVYAVGDFTADIALVNVAELEGRHAVERMFDNNYKPLIYNNISTIMFLNPEVASVGVNETQAKQNKIPYKLASIKYKYVSRAIAMRKMDGFIKILVSDDEEMKILGMRVIGDHASSTIEAIALLISMEKSIKVLAELIHPHPSIPEGIQECARMLMGNSIIKPEVFNLDLKCYRVTSEGKVENLIFENSNILEGS